MSPEAIARRLDEVRELNRLTAYLGEYGNASNRLWVAAATVLALEPSRRVPCPACRRGPLEVTDQPLDADHLERHMRCSACGAYNSMRMLTAVTGA